MAVDPPPGTPNPDQTPPPQGSHTRPASLPPAADWLNPPDDVPAEIHADDVLFDELIAESEPAEGLIDLNHLDPDPAQASGTTYLSDSGMEDPGEEPETVFPPPPAEAILDLPPPEVELPIPDWFDEPSALEPSPSRIPEQGAPTSDVILGQHRDTSEDALGADAVRNASSSSIFEAPPQGSSRFDNPADPTEAVPTFDLPPPSDLLIDLEDSVSPSGSSGSLFGDMTESAHDDDDDSMMGGPIESLESGPVSGVLSSDSSIFNNLRAPDSAIGAADLLGGHEDDLNQDIHDLSQLSQPSSHIFMPESADDDNSGDAEVGKVSFALPPQDPEDATSARSGQIDWGTSSSGVKVTDRITSEEAEAAGIPDLAALASQADTMAPVTTPAPKRQPAPLPTSTTKAGTAQHAALPQKPTRREPEPREPTRRGGLVGWVGGTAVGLLAGVGLSSAAYFGGLVPNASPETGKTALVGPSPELQTQLADLTQRLEQTQAQAIKAEASATQSAKDLTTARQLANQLRADLTNATTTRVTVSQELIATRKSLTETQTLLRTAQNETRTAVEKAKSDGAKLLADQMKLLDLAQADLLAKSTQLKEAESKLADAQTRQKTADATLGSVVTELKAAKLLDEKDDGPAALAKLPEVLKRAAALASSADAQKAAAALLASQKETAAALSATREAQEQAKKAETALKVAQQDAQTALMTAQAEAAKAVAAATAESRLTILQLQAEKKQAEQDFAAKLAAREDEHRKQLEAARAGVVIPLSSGEIAARERAADVYGVGLEAYFAGRYVQAEAAFLKATQIASSDARFWYFLGLTRFQLGHPTAAQAFQKGGELESQNQPATRTITAALERVQGPARAALNAHRP